MKITVLGIGMMGLPMASRLVGAGHEVHVWNRSIGKAQAVAGAGVHTHARDAVADAELVIALLSDGDAVLSTLTAGGVAEAMPSGALWVDMSSIRPAQAQAHARLLAARGLGALDAPVSGGTVGAEQGSLAIMVGGDPADFERAAPVLAHLGRATWVGPSGSGQLAKLANQMIVGITIGAVAEALLLCQAGGADMGRVRQAISGGFADSRILQLHGQRMIDQDFAPRARMTVQLKDMRNALHTAQALGFSAPITALFESLYAAAVAHDLADADHSALMLELQRRQSSDA